MLIYQPLFDKNASKAEVAQELASILHARTEDPAALRGLLLVQNLVGLLQLTNHALPRLDLSDNLGRGVDALTAVNHSHFTWSCCVCGPQSIFFATKATATHRDWQSRS